MPTISDGDGTRPSVLKSTTWVVPRRADAAAIRHAADQPARLRRPEGTEDGRCGAAVGGRMVRAVGLPLVEGEHALVLGAAGRAKKLLGLSCALIPGCGSTGWARSARAAGGSWPGLGQAAVAGVVEVAEPGGLGDQALDAAAQGVASAPVAGRAASGGRRSGRGRPAGYGTGQVPTRWTRPAAE
jgi:hypothetical protein